MKRWIEKKLVLQEMDALRAVEKLSLSNEAETIILYGDDDKGRMFLTDLFRDQADIIITACNNIEKLEWLASKSILIEGTDNEMEDVWPRIRFRYNKVLVSVHEKPDSKYLNGTEKMFEVKKIDFNTRKILIDEICMTYNLCYDARIADDIAAKTTTIREIMDGVSSRLEQKANTESGEHRDGLCHAFDAPTMRTTVFVLWHLVPVFSLFVILALLSLNGFGYGLSSALIVQVLTIAIFLLIEKERCQTVFGIVFNSLVSLNLAFISVIIRFII